MIKIIFIFLLIALPVFAQDGLREDISVPTESATRAATSSAPSTRSANPVSPAGSVTPRPTIAATSAPALATSEPTSKESAPSSNSDVLGITVFAAAVLALSGYGAYKLKTQNQNKKDSKKESQCFDLKKMMENKFKEMRELLEKYPNRKILLTGADDRQFKEWGLDKMPYEIWTLKHNPEKTDPEYYKKMLAHFGLGCGILDTKRSSI